MAFNRRSNRQKRHQSIRKKIYGTSSRPRLCVFRSEKHIYAQIVDDNLAGGGSLTLCSASSQNKDLRSVKGNTQEAAKAVGSLIAKKAREKGIEQVVFDRGGFIYHGRVQSLAEGAREAGLKF